MALTTYKRKRDFEESPEPEGKTRKPGKDLIFVVQRHKATRLHYDFRIEVNGVLKSWAVPKGPSMNPADKRLAMMVEDHPYDYKDFKGVIPKGNYGAGIVEIWDKGTYNSPGQESARKTQQEVLKGISNGNLKIHLKGKKLKGEFALVKLKKEDPDDNSWLMIKHRDNDAVDSYYDSEEQTSAKSPINKWKREHPAGKSRRKNIPVTNETQDAKPKEDDKQSASKGKDDKVFSFGEATVKITHYNKVYFPDDQITKGMIVEYYQQMADYILPYLTGRPQSLKRNPGGIKAQGFYHKDAGEDAPEWIDKFSVPSEVSDRVVDYIICNNKATLMYMNNLGCIEINPWHSTISAVERPDYLIIDLDPSPKNTFDEVVNAANVVKSVLDRCGAPAYCKTSGATGIHIYIPLEKKYDYESAREFAHVIALLAHESFPEKTSLERSLARRGSKIYIDYLQNKKSQTIASVYSVRPVPGASVSTPLEWKELKPGIDPKQFTIFNVHKRLQKKGDLFAGILGRGINMQKCLTMLAPRL